MDEKTEQLIRLLVVHDCEYDEARRAAAATARRQRGIVSKEEAVRQVLKIIDEVRSAP